MYPCDDNRLLNFVCIHPREESDPGSIEGESKLARLVANLDDNKQLINIFCNRLEQHCQQDNAAQCL